MKKNVCLFFIAVLILSIGIWYKFTTSTSHATRTYTSNKAASLSSGLKTRSSLVYERNSELLDIIKNPENSGLTEKEMQTLEFARLLQRDLLRDEDKAIESLLSLDLDEWSVWVIVEALVLHFSQKDDLFAGIKLLEQLCNSEVEPFYTETVTELLRSHSSEQHPDTVLAYLTDPSNHDLALNASSFAAQAMMAGKDTNHQEVFEKIRTTDVKELRQMMTDGALVQWSNEDEADFMAYLDETPVNQEFVEGYSRSSFILRKFLPKEAMNVASKIENVDVRRSALAYAAFSLSEYEPEAFRAWLNEIDDHVLRERVKKMVSNK